MFLFPSVLNNVVDQWWMLLLATRWTWEGILRLLCHKIQKNGISWSRLTCPHISSNRPSISAGNTEMGQKWVSFRQNGTNWDFFRSDFSTFWLIWKSPGFMPFCANLTHFVFKSNIPTQVTWQDRWRTRLPDLAPKWVRLAPNGTNLVTVTDISHHLVWF